MKTAISGKCESCGSYLLPLESPGLAVCSTAVHGKCDSGRLVAAPRDACLRQYVIQMLPHAQVKPFVGTFVNGIKHRRIRRMLRAIDFGKIPKIAEGNVLAVCMNKKRLEVFELAPCQEITKSKD